MGTYASLKNCSAEDQSAAFDRGVDGKGGVGRDSDHHFHPRETRQVGFSIYVQPEKVSKYADRYPARSYGQPAGRTSEKRMGEQSDVPRRPGAPRPRPLLSSPSGPLSRSQIDNNDWMWTFECTFDFTFSKKACY